MFFTLFVINSITEKLRWINATATVMLCSEYEEIVEEIEKKKETTMDESVQISYKKQKRLRIEEKCGRFYTAHNW